MAGIGLRLDELPGIGPAALCMGVFDGVHRGHRALIDATRRVATERGVRSVALVFDPHPDDVIHPGTTMPRLATPGRNVRMLQEAGIDHALLIRFDAELRALTPEQFLAGMGSAIALRALVMTPESAFGRGRAGTPEAMREYGRATGFDLVLAQEIVRDGDELVSSGRIRSAVKEGRIDDAARLLGHPPTLEGRLVRTPAASDGARPLAIDYPAVLPPPGSYPVEVAGDGVIWLGSLTISTDGELHLAPGAAAGDAPDEALISITGRSEEVG
jgi:riboflavin kinase/FMN adenylyltransferase